MRLHTSLHNKSQEHAKHGWLSDPRVERLRRVLTNEGIKPVYKPIV